MSRHGLVSLGISFGLLFTVSCGQKAPTDTVKRGNTGDSSATGSQNTGSNNSNPGGTTGGTNPGGVVLPSQQVAKSQDFFTDKVLPLVKAAPCSDCHADPRQVVLQQGGLAPQNFTTMFGLLKDGSGANNNRLFNMMRGIVSHPGGAQCTTETSPFCAVLQEWYRTVFGEGVLSLGRINDIGAAGGSVTGWAGNSAAATAVFKARFYIDGESGKVAAAGEVTANQEANDNNIDGPHGFSFKIPPASIDNKPHKLYAYAVDAAGKETPMAGSPYTYTAFKPKGTPAAMQQYTTIVNGCNGACHTFTYETRWPTLVGGFGTAGWGSMNNSLYNKFSSGQHGGPQLTGLTAATKTWFELEFPEIVAP